MCIIRGAPAGTRPIRIAFRSRNESDVPTAMALKFLVSLLLEQYFPVISACYASPCDPKIIYSVLGLCDLVSIAREKQNFETSQLLQIRWQDGSSLPSSLYNTELSTNPLNKQPYLPCHG